MGFGFNLGMIFIILPLTGLLLIVWFITRKRFIGYFLAIIWGGIISLVLLVQVTRLFFEKMTLDKNDFYGEYVIDRSYFKGVQADWQYNHFRFKITEEDSIFFYVTEGERIVQTYSGTIWSPNWYNSARIGFVMNQPTHHVVSSNPTVYRDIWNFHLVFYSPKFNNMYFKKGKWKAVKK